MKIELYTKTAPPPCCHVSQQTGTILELSRYILRTNDLTNWTQKRLQEKTAPPPGVHFHEDCTINVKVLTSFHEDQTRNVTCRVLTSQNVDDGRRTTDKR
ncbi:hypothetical protein DPMN_096938 [Dreissena polymorpha]|uniref:Uncharacterized protein n=1 Tax=Dreissena polymorpha TaxID=45954 RepID=A0A9D4LCB7_DREPO|nr:hypothetical protein DPMN_096938 [Dreissena polymorpha]